MGHIFDRKVDYETAKNRLQGALTIEKYKKSEQYLRMINILLIALRNGARAGEAIASYNGFVASNERKTTTKSEKRGYKYTFKVNESGQRIYNIDKKGNRRPIVINRRITPYYRKIIIPNEVKNLGEYRKSGAYLTTFSIKNFGFNPHTLRFAFISEMAKTHDAVTVSKMVAHTNSTMTEHYIRQEQADKALRDDVPW